MLSIRRAIDADAIALSRFAAHVFAEAFAAGNDPADMADYMSRAFSLEQQTAEIAEPGSVVLLAEETGTNDGVRLAGYAHLRSAEAPAAVSGTAPLELKRFYVDARHRGGGLAHALMSAVLRTAADGGAGTLWLGVWEHNARAIAFYRRHGFERVGEHVFVLGRDRQTDWIMARAM